MNLRPSSLPAIAACPQYQADERDNDDTNEGTRRHAVLHYYNLTGEFEIPDGGLTDESQGTTKFNNLKANFLKQSNESENERTRLLLR